MAATLNEALRAWAKGIYPTMAGVELLIATGKAYRGQPWIRGSEGLPRGGGYANISIDVDELLYESGVWSGQEQRLARIAASLLDGPAVNLSDEISGLDTDVLDTVLACLALAGGVPSLHPHPTKL